MKILKNPLVPLLVAVCICIAFGIFMSGDPFPSKEIYGYKPMVYVNDQIYHDIGIVVQTLPEEAVLAGEVKEKVSNVEPMVERNYVSNSLEEGTEIYTCKDELDEIYLKLDESKYIKYIRLVEDDFD